MKIEKVEIILLSLPLKEYFETSFGRMETRAVFLVKVFSEGLIGYGEVVGWELPLYSAETIETCRHAIRDFLAPAMMTKPIESLDDLARRFARFKGHNMAKAGLELAYCDLMAQSRQVSLSKLLGGCREVIPVGVSLGIRATIDELMERVERHLNLGYQRIKLKIKPGWDVKIVAAVRQRFPDILLSVDANSAYALKDAAIFQALDDFNLLMIEQPLDADDLLDHAKLQAQINTSICLDESIKGPMQVRQALEIDAARIINMKVGRVGGYSQALAIHEICQAAKIPMWCGGMLESGIGRAHNVALASLANFTLPGDVSASSRYFDRDIIDPEICINKDGTIAVPTAPGLGFTPNEELIRQKQIAREVIQSSP